MLLPSDDEGACDVFLKIFTGPPGPTPASLLQKIKDTKVVYHAAYLFDAPVLFLIFWGR